MKFLGIDPGKSGAFCILSEDGKILELKVMPINKEDKTLHVEGIADYLKTIVPSETIVFLEKVKGWQGKGAAGMFNFGACYGSIRGCLCALGFLYSLVEPLEWQKILRGAPGQKAKEKAKWVAMNLFPDNDFLATPRSKTPHDGLMDAVLIAEYGRLKTLKDQSS